MSKASFPERLKWDDEAGYGFYPVPPASEDVYGRGYHQKYMEYMKTELGHRLNVFRSEFVDHFWQREIVDIGSAAGHFMMVHGLWRTWGYEVNQNSVRWLLDIDRFRNPFLGEPARAMSFFDSLEHIKDPSDILSRVTRYVFMSIPIFRGREHVLSSRHFREDEHYWYFTRAGLVSWMRARGFGLAGTRNDETRLGREDIESFAFVRIV